MTTSSSIKALLVVLATLFPVVTYAQGNTAVQAKPTLHAQASMTGSVNAGQININTASKDELAHLLQGSEGKAQAEAKAQLIISKRPYTSLDASLEELSKILDQKTFDAIKNKIAVK